MNKFSINSIIKTSIYTILYLLWVIWLGKYIWLLGVPVVIDIYLTKKVNWTFWKKRNPKGGKHSFLVEWLDAIIFAVVAASFIRMFFVEAYTIPTSSMEKSMLIGDYLFVDKVTYGPRLPNTPLSIPFMHNTNPLNGEKAYSEAISWPYERIGGLSSVKRGDPIVFNFPEGDTVAMKQQAASYHSLVRNLTRRRVVTDKLNFGEIISRPVDKRDNYVKRCVAIAGDTLEVRKSVVYVNGKAYDDIEGLQHTHKVYTDGSNIRTLFEELDIRLSDISISKDHYLAPLTEENAAKLLADKRVTKVERVYATDTEKDIFPFDGREGWNVDNVGPIYIPAAGVPIDLTLENLPFYRRLIEIYEGNSLTTDESGKIYIEGKEVNSYIPKMDYYWMMGDNRHNSADSRYWGYVPEDHIVGKPLMIFMSVDKDKSFPSNIRWSRLLNLIR